MEDQKRIQEALLSLLEATSNVASEPDLMQSGLESLVGVINTRYGAISLLDETGKITKFVYTGITQEEVERIGHFPEGKGLLF